MNIYQSKLSNGLSVMFVDTKSFPTMTMMVLVGAGSRYENLKNNGISHFIEHMAFKGSKKYPSAYDISSTIEGFGGEFNAFTSKDHTGYWVKAPNEHFEKTCDVLADMLLNPILDENEIEREKQVIIEEINMYEDTPARKVSDVFDSLIFQDYPLGYETTGSVQSVNSLTKKSFEEYNQDYYLPTNTTIIVAGGLCKESDDKKIYERYKYIISEKFGKWNRREKRTLNIFSINQKKSQLKVRYKKTDQAHISLGFRAFPFSDKRRYALNILGTILGGGMSSRLFIELRERRGLCYYISTGSDLYVDCGYIVTQAGVSTDIKKVNNALKIIKDEHKKIAEGDLSDKEIARAKALYKGRLLLMLEDSSNVASVFGTRKLLHGEIFDPQKVVSEIEKVSKNQLVSLASELFVQKGLNIACVGPFSKKDIEIES